MEGEDEVADRDLVVTVRGDGGAVVALGDNFHGLEVADTVDFFLDALFPFVGDVRTRRSGRWWGGKARKNGGKRRRRGAGGGGGRLCRGIGSWSSRASKRLNSESVGS